jgi:diguanylate cyclase (GGDEF)-like protein
MGSFNEKTTIVDDKSIVYSKGRHPYLVIYIGNDNGRRFKLNNGFMTIGRSLQADISIDDDQISRIHCVIEWMGDTITVEDKGSTNGTYINGQKISRATLQPGVPIQLGYSIMKIEYKTEAEIQSEQNLLPKASLDVLTGIFNRYHFTKLASKEIAYAIRHKLPIGVIVMDIDNFERVNDLYGHQNGDLILAQFANTINENKRTEDLFGRYSSDEFIILPRGEMSKESIQVYCEHLRKAAQSFEFCFEQTCVRITISLGFHLAKTQRSNADTMLLLWNMKG